MLSDKHTMVTRWVGLGATVGLLGCVACGERQEFRVDTTNLPKIGVEYELTERQICLVEGSPEVRLTGLPGETTSYDVLMTDLDSPRFRHWMETITSQEPVIPAGRGTHYSGPRCPPNGHRYRIGVLARNAQQQPIAYGEKTITAERARGLSRWCSVRLRHYREAGG
jgi:phosphatidylethanolamine-binding protein (PEBP) family uncharacterized protein